MPQSPASSPVPAGAAGLSALLRQPQYVRFWLGRFLGNLGATAQAVIIGWQVYALARHAASVQQAALMVGMVGLAEFLPQFALTLTAGEMVDRHQRRLILLACVTVQFLTVSALAAQTQWGGGQLWPIFAASAVFGATRAFFLPATGAVGPMLVPPELLPRSIAANSLAWQTSAILGPALGGLLCAVSPAAGFAACMALYAAAGTCFFLISANTQPDFTPGRSRMALIKEGLAYVRGNKIVLGAISLDLVAVLLGGATALLPVFARDILRVGPEGFGALRAAPAAGAMVVAAILAVRPIRRQAGLRMFLAVAAFGLMTLVFAFSRSFLLSLTALVALGAADMVSVFVRSSLIQIVTPDAMRGRVSAVSYLFVGASNELGEFETGVVARLLGPIGAAAFGGIGSLVATGLWARLFPALRKADRLV